MGAPGRPALGSRSPHRAGDLQLCEWDTGDLPAPRGQPASPNSRRPCARMWEATGLPTRAEAPRGARGQRVLRTGVRRPCHLKPGEPLHKMEGATTTGGGGQNDGPPKMSIP